MGWSRDDARLMLVEPLVDLFAFVGELDSGSIGASLALAQLGRRRHGRG